MMNEMQLKDTIRELVDKVLKEEMEKAAGTCVAEKAKVAPACSNDYPEETTRVGFEEGEVEDVTAPKIQDMFFVPNPHDLEGYLKMKQTTPARLGIWRAGPRHITASTLRFWADHSAAQNAVWCDVADETVKELGAIPLRTVAVDKAEYLKNPNTGKRLDASSLATVKEKGKKANVQVVLADGLSSSAIEKNAYDTVASLNQGLDALGLTRATPFFVTNGRVAIGDEIGEITDADVIVMLVGERPGLNSTASMGAYIVYKPKMGMEESRRTVISNIHAVGTVPVEAGTQIAELCQSMIKHKMSGVELKLVENG